ncbi:MAG: hypothetical protein PHD70_05660 [Anaerostipes sp.]|nr:hypothetical protein [Anaerostipes sp.]
MKKIMMMIAMVTMVLSFSISVMALDSPEKYDETPETNDEGSDKTTDDEYSENLDGEDDSSSSSSSDESSSTSPKTADDRTTTGLVFTVLVAATMIIYAGKRVTEEN